MRFALLAALSLLAAGATAQLRPDEAKALDDAMTLANLRPEDLGGVAGPVGAYPVHLAALKSPLVGLGEISKLHAGATADEVALLRAALTLTGVASGKAADSGVADVPALVPASLRRPVGSLVGAIGVANAEVRAATSRLSAEEKRTLIEALPRLAVDDPTLPLDFAKGPAPDFTTVRRLLDLVDVPRIEAAGIQLTRVVRETIPLLQASAGAKFQKLVFRSRGMVVELAGSGPDLHDRRDVGLCIDLGGDDRYTGRYAAGAGYASVLIDLSGNDRYYGSDLNLGAGLLGIGLLFDLSGDDVYAVRSVGLGCGLAGLGLFSDTSGDDRYRVVGLGIGAGARGLGLFVDRLGDDAYFAGRSGEGFGNLGGVGWSIDGAGEDTYRGGADVQAAARENGFGILTDVGGNDLYQAESGQAEAVGGFAALEDSRGDDEYVARSNAQGFAAAGGVSYLVDREGDDSYLLKQGPGQAAAFGAVAMLVDREGSDVYGGTDGSPATAYRGGVAILLDSGGDDRYLAASPFRGNDDGIALWVDAGGRDRYGEGRGDAQAAVNGQNAAYDVFGATEGGAAAVPAPVPGSLPMPSAPEFAILARRATDGPDRSAAITRLVGIGVPALEGLSSLPGGEDAFVAVATRLGASAGSTVGRLLASIDANAIRLALRTAGYVPLSADGVIAALARPELAMIAAEAAGRAKVAAALPTLMKMAASPEVGTVRVAAEALALIGDAQAGATAAALADHPDLAVRRSAQKFLVTQPGLAMATSQRLVATGEVFRQRIGLALYGKLGTPEALAVVGPFLKSGSRDVKIGALLALDGHVPVALVADVEALRRDPDPLVRAVAERIDVGS
jgi:hypothetical protein